MSGAPQIPALGGYDGRLELVADGLVLGWAIDWSNPTDRVSLQVVLDGEFAGATVADIPRPTLANEGIGDGAHGFALQLPGHLRDDASHVVSVLFPDGEPLRIVEGFEVKISVPSPGSDSPGGGVTRTLRLWPVSQIKLPRRAGQTDFDANRHAETVMLCEQVPVRRGQSFEVAVQPGVTDAAGERSQREALEPEYLAGRVLASRLPGGLVDTDSFLICPDESQYLLDSVRAHWTLRRSGFSIGEGGLLEYDCGSIPRRDEKVVVLGAQSTHNYFHWLLESLARALLYRPLDDGSALYLTPPLLTWQRETLHMIGIGPERILELGRRGPVQFREVISVSRGITLIHEPIPEAVAALADLASPVTPSRRIYISRKHAAGRRIANEPEVAEVLTRFGFQTVVCESLGVPDEIELFSGAAVVLGVHGAGLANIVFAQPGTQVIELCPEGTFWTGNATYRTLAALRGQPLLQVVCRVDPATASQPEAVRDIVVDIRHLEALLERVLPAEDLEAAPRARDRPLPGGDVTPTSTTVTPRPLAGGQFVSQEALDAALRRDASAGGQSLELLLRSAELIADGGPDSLIDGDPGYNLFFVHSCLLDLALAARVRPSERLAAALSELLGSLSPERLTQERLPTEVHWGYVSCALAVALELAGPVVDPSALETARAGLEHLAARLERQTATEAWGRHEPHRAAWNHAAIAFAGLGSAGIALERDDWSLTGVERAQAFFEHGVSEAGMTREGMAYAGFVFRSLGLMLWLARGAGVHDFLDSSHNPYLERLARVPEWYAGEVFPTGGWVQNLNASHCEPRQPISGMLLMFATLRPGLCRLIWDATLGSGGQGSHGFDPHLGKSLLFEALLHLPAVAASDEGPEIFHCPDVGYLRRWSKDRRDGFSFNCGRYIGAIHDHSDNNHVTMFAEGVPLLIDAPARSELREGNAASSFGHNLVVIDGHGQRPAEFGDGISGEIVDYRHGEDWTLVAGDARDSYSAGGYNPVLRALRWSVFVLAPVPYLLMYDDIDKDGLTHRYELLLQTPRPQHAQVGASDVRLALAFGGAAVDAQISVLAPELASIEREDVQSDQIPLGNHTRWHVVAETVNPEFLTLVWGGSRTPRATVDVADTCLSVTIEDGEGAVDEITLPRGGHNREASAVVRHRKEAPVSVADPSRR